MSFLFPLHAYVMLQIQSQAPRWSYFEIISDFVNKKEFP